MLSPGMAKWFGISHNPTFPVLAYRDLLTEARKETRCREIPCYVMACLMKCREKAVICHEIS